MKLDDIINGIEQECRFLEGFVDDRTLDTAYSIRVLCGELMKHCDPEHVRLMEAVCEAAERWSREDETPNIARNEHALVCATAALDAYRKERGIE